MATILDAMGAVGGAIALIDRLAENPKGRERTLDSLRLDLIYANADAVSNDWMKRYEGRKRAEKALAAIKRKIATLRRAGTWDERFTDYYLGKQTRDDVAENPKMRGFPNIEKSGFAKGAYVGYGHSSVYRIKKVGNLWRATKQSGNGPAFLNASTMAELSAALELSDNPRGRSKRSINRPSQITKRAPTKRLLKRRKATAKAPAGFFANPISSVIAGMPRRAWMGGTRAPDPLELSPAARKAFVQAREEFLAEQLDDWRKYWGDEPDPDTMKTFEGRATADAWATVREAFPKEHDKQKARQYPDAYTRSGKPRKTRRVNPLLPPEKVVRFVVQSSDSKNGPWETHSGYGSQAKAFDRARLIHKASPDLFVRVITKQEKYAGSIYSD